MGLVVVPLSCLQSSLRVFVEAKTTSANDKNLSTNNSTKCWVCEGRRSGKAQTGDAITEATHRHMLVSILGIVFDVSSSPQFYGEGGPYSLLVGHDVSFLLATAGRSAELDEKCLDKPISGIEDVCESVLPSWIGRFTGKYDVIGTLPPEEVRSLGLDKVSLRARVLQSLEPSSERANKDESGESSEEAVREGAVRKSVTSDEDLTQCPHSMQARSANTATSTVGSLGSSDNKQGNHSLASAWNKQLDRGSRRGNDREGGRETTDSVRMTNREGDRVSAVASEAKCLRSPSTDEPESECDGEEAHETETKVETSLRGPGCADALSPTDTDNGTADDDVPRCPLGFGGGSRGKKRGMPVPNKIFFFDERGKLSLAEHTDAESRLVDEKSIPKGVKIDRKDSEEGGDVVKVCVCGVVYELEADQIGGANEQHLLRRCSGKDISRYLATGQVEDIGKPLGFPSSPLTFTQQKALYGTKTIFERHCKPIGKLHPAHARRYYGSTFGDPTGEGGTKSSTALELSDASEDTTQKLPYSEPEGTRRSSESSAGARDRARGVEEGLNRASLDSADSVARKDGGKSAADSRGSAEEESEADRDERARKTVIAAIGAIDLDDDRALRSLLQGCGLNVDARCPRTGLTLLHKAVEVNSKKCANLLVSSGASLTAGASLYDNDSPLMLARRLRRLEIESFLHQVSVE